MNPALIGKGLLIVARTGVELMKIGAWGAMQQYTGQQFRGTSDKFIGDVTRASEYTITELKLIKNDRKK